MGDRMQVYNSLTHRMEEFTPLEKGRVQMYVCGLTPYDHAHIGHTRTYVAFDVIKRYLTARGYAVQHIQNITDVEDKILNRCRELGTIPAALTETNHREALEYFDRLRIQRADNYPKVTEHISEIVALIQRLMERGYAYETESGVYYTVGKFNGYGKLSGQRMEEIKAGTRVEVEETKRAPEDFALWKKSKGELLEFDSPWGRGRPGWHIECSAMAGKYAPGGLDIHGGARDLIFPHHENEIAQSEAATNQPFCRYWLHTGFLTVRGEKMSKSLGNFITVREVVGRFSVNAIRLFFLQTHYRSPIDYSEEAIAAAGESVERIFNTLGLIQEIDESISHRPGMEFPARREEKTAKADRRDAEFEKKSRERVAGFYAHMDNDFDTPNALAALFNLVRTINAHLEGRGVDRNALGEMEKELGKMLSVLGLEEEGKIDLETKREALNALLREVGEKEEATAEKALEKLVEVREALRKKKEYQKSDTIRKKLGEIGIVLEDKDGGEVRWKIA